MGRDYRIIENGFGEFMLQEDHKIYVPYSREAVSIGTWDTLSSHSNLLDATNALESLINKNIKETKSVQVVNIWTPDEVLRKKVNENVD